MSSPLPAHTDSATNSAAAQPDPEAAPVAKPSVLRVIRDQKKIVFVALALVVAAYWILIQIDRITLAGCISIGIGLGLINHLVTEYWLLKLISSGQEPSRAKIATSTFIRLMVLTAVAIGIAVVFWPDGVGLLLGLALFRLIALVMTGLVLLKELKKV